MNVAPLFAAPLATQLHVAATLLALVSGVVVLAMAKGTRLHLAFGRLFAAAMLAAAITSFWITGLWPGRYSPLHILSIVTLTTLPLAILARRRGNIRAHAIGMTLNFAGLVIAGLFTLAPGRLTHQLFAMALFGS